MDSYQKTSSLKAKIVESLESGEFQQFVDQERSSVVAKTTVDVDATLDIIGDLSLECRFDFGRM